VRKGKDGCKQAGVIVKYPIDTVVVYGMSAVCLTITKVADLM
jgi:hypothetical protein